MIKIEVSMMITAAQLKQLGTMTVDGMTEINHSLHKTHLMIGYEDGGLWSINPNGEKKQLRLMNSPEEPESPVPLYMQDSYLQAIDKMVDELYSK